MNTIATDMPCTETAVIQANGIEIAYQTFGNANDEPLLLIMGLGTQMIGWDDRFCAQLAQRGFWVIRFDNRDIGLSTKFHEAGVPSMLDLLGMLVNRTPPAVYTLADMADDAVGLLDALNVNSAHIVGASMGGMIAQTLAIRSPTRVSTLTSIMSTTGAADLPRPRPRALWFLLRPAPMEKRAFVKGRVRTWRYLHGPGFPPDEARIRDYANRVYERGLYPEGGVRQLVAIGASGSRREALRQIKIPTLVIHGDADPLVPVDGGIDTAESIPNAKLHLIHGLGHALPPQVWPEVIELIEELATSAVR